MKVLLGVTGGIAAYKSLELVRLFVKAGHQVQVVMTAGAKEFIQPLSFQALSGNPVRDQLFDENQEAGMGHIELARWADLVVIAPCSAETVAKLRMGRADDLLMTLCLATDRPMMLAPAMNRLMWSNDATQENIAMLQQRGMEIIAPAEGEQACGEVGAGRMPEPEAIFAQAERYVAEQQKNAQAWAELSPFWRGKHLLITAGPTFEDLDPVRFIGNRSSGKMGFAIAEVAHKLGAQVTLIAGPVVLNSSPDISRVNVRSAQQMFEAVQSRYAKQDVFISAAAVADFRPAKQSIQKIKKTTDQEEMTLQLVKNPDIVAWVAQQENKPFVVGFAAETEDVLSYAQSKLKRKQLDMICANQVGGNLGFESEQNALTLITRDTVEALTASNKKQQALELLKFIASLNPL
ncbi:bifunctional phosphopantothenoylcysteine decarboxylase/phosphopantothenate--cysteine ligase CoaBC [Hydrogenovibrio sp. 3SP14C1]|uniref:bifunctional phosphopantothenoylcysteine decarboxylase/phosphopantothenate--cysteine ligase CoaBC n=1 Tax=Hydrogenovibrio sp. 3SP14C1 TaxID=3038774 RepID=UPI002415DA4A|nr:bifunctional phosphopantothenoylcysteine decarboxylase/phosphopantothenate--cysteine ligase CoaBC [Hydrogenovibrio sp. 3SP14C1]MDG4812590.1 bifunctional phosphopantothenoylcysteine decarboxylase/phosphopantothenate--cysteine ligase CoaBC [Hydrogenovibrio sp. 3SP14C1]